MPRAPVFVSMPSKLGQPQQTTYDFLSELLHQYRIEGCTVGRTDHALGTPLGEVYRLAKRCSGGLILGFRQMKAQNVTMWPGSPREAVHPGDTYAPSMWNHLEAGILFSLGVPLLVFAEDGVSGGIFDRGVGDIFIHPLPIGDLDNEQKENFSALVSEWSRHVVNHYRDDISKNWRR